MSKSSFFTPPLWDRFSKKMKMKLETLRSFGTMTKEEAEMRSLIFGETSQGSLEEGLFLSFTFIIDPQEGTIADAKYRGFCDAAHLALCEIAITFIIGKTVGQVNRFTKDLFIKQTFDNESVPPELEEPIEFIIKMLKNITTSAPLPSTFSSPLPEPSKEGGHYEGFETLSKEEKLRVIEEVFDAEIRPYVALDEGGVKILDLNNNELSISYEGSCTSCYSSIGSTLSAIQEILQEKLDKSLTVVPNMDNFQF